ncbi:MAG: outer membrane beta-barrel protein, partial [Bacteroidota bacterium]
INLSLQLPIELGSKLSLNLGGSGAWRRYRLSHTIEAFEGNYFTYNLNGNLRLQLPWEMSAELSGWYAGPFHEGSKVFEGFGMLNAGFQKQWKNSSVQLSVSDLFQSMNIWSYFGELTPEAYQAQTGVLFRPESSFRRVIRISYQYNFGNRDLKGRKRSKEGASEERARLAPN